MLKSINDVPLDPITEGVISENILSHYVSPKGSISYAENFHNDSLGVMTTRRMFTSVGTSPTARALSCVLYTLTAGGSSGVQSILWQQGAVLYRQQILGSGSVDNFPGTFGISSLPQRFDQVQGKLLMTNGTGQPRYYDGTTASGGTPTVLGTSFPNTVNLISSGFIGRVWTADSTDSSNKLYYSDVIPAGGVTAVTGGASFLTINANSGDKITGFARLQNVLYVFTHNGIFRCYNTQSLDNTSLAQVGCFNQEAIVQAKNGFYFYHPSGIYYLGSNGFPQEVSGKIRDIIQKIPNANQGSVFGWSDDDHVYFNVGLLPGLSSIKQYILRYTVSTQVWTMYAISNSGTSLTFTCAASTNFASTAITSDDIYPINYIFADDTVSFFKGTFNVFLPTTVNSSVTNDFNSIPIYAEFETNWLVFDNETHVKRVNGFAIASENAAGFRVAYRVDKDQDNTWREVGELSESYITLFNEFQSTKFNRIKFRVYGEPKGVTVKIGTMMIRKLDDLGYEYN